MRRPNDWLRQAELDVEMARVALGAGRAEWACFAAQQGAEKAVKALHEAEGTEARGHSVAALLEGLADVPSGLLDAAKALDKHYVPARYPNAHPVGAPGDSYTASEAERAIAQAEEVLGYARSRLPPA